MWLRQGRQQQKPGGHQGKRGRDAGGKNGGLASPCALGVGLSLEQPGCLSGLVLLYVRFMCAHKSYSV